MSTLKILEILDDKASKDYLSEKLLEKVPLQTGHQGSFLYTNGNETSWHKFNTEECQEDLITISGTGYNGSADSPVEFTLKDGMHYTSGLNQVQVFVDGAKLNPDEWEEEVTGTSGISCSKVKIKRKIDDGQKLDVWVNTHSYFATTGDGSWVGTTLTLTGEIASATSYNGVEEVVTQSCDLEINPMNSACFTKTITLDTDITITDNLPSTANSVLSLLLVNGGSHTVTWPSNVYWEGGSIPELTEEGTDVLTLLTFNGGAVWIGIPVAMDVSAAE